MVESYKFTLALVITVFFTIKTKLSHLRFLFYNLLKINSLKPFYKYLSIINLAMVSIELYINKINYKYPK